MAFLEEEVSGLGGDGRFSGRGDGEQKAQEAQRPCGLHVGCGIWDDAAESALSRGFWEPRQGQPPGLCRWTGLGLRQAVLCEQSGPSPMCVAVSTGPSGRVRAALEASAARGIFSKRQ